MEDYKPNSNKFKETQDKLNEKKVEKVVTGKVITKKKTKMNKFLSEFISEDARSVKSYVLGDVLIPAIKKAISDIVTDGIDIILYGESRGRNNRKRPISDRVSYSGYYNSGRRNITESQALTIGTLSIDDIILSTRGEAEDVLSRMDELLDSYGLVSVADLYDLVGLTNTNYMNNKYGWTNIRNAEIIRVRDGYLIKMPRVMPID